MLTRVCFYFIDWTNRPIFTILGINVMSLESTKVCTVLNNNLAEFGASSGQGNPTSPAQLVC